MACFMTGRMFIESPFRQNFCFFFMCGMFSRRTRGIYLMNMCYIPSGDSDYRYKTDPFKFKPVIMSPHLATGSLRFQLGNLIHPSITESFFSFNFLWVP